MITPAQQAVLEAVHAHGPLTFRELADATDLDWSVVHTEVRALQRSGHVVVLADERVRLSAPGSQHVARKQAPRDGGAHA